MGNLRKQVPVNYLLLFMITASMGIMLAPLCVYFTPDSVLFSIGILCAAVVSLCSAALVTPISIKLVIYLLIGLCVGVFLQRIAVICLVATGFYSSYWYVVYGILGMGIAGILLFIDVIKVQLLGKVAVDEYILGALLLYLDIIRLLLYILMIFGKGK